MTYPTYSVGTITETVGSVVHHKPKMPNVIDEGNTIVAVGGFSKEFASGDFTVPSGWSKKFVQGYTDSNPTHEQLTHAIFTKIADGTEDGKTPTFDTASQCYSAWVVHRIVNAAASFVGDLDLSDSYAPNATHAPTDAVAATRGVQDYLVMSTYSRRTNLWAAGSGPPPGYTMGKHAEASGGEVQVGTAFIEVNDDQYNVFPTPYWDNTSSPALFLVASLQLALSAIA
jgi:hypothetical protein